MIFKPNPYDTLNIFGITYQIAEHPSAPGYPYAQEGRTGIVYRLDSIKPRALKVFRSRFITPLMVSHAYSLREYSFIPGLSVCDRLVLTPDRSADLLQQYPDLTYAICMPWIEGTTWQEILMRKKTLFPDLSLRIANYFCEILASLEEKGLAHGDLSPANIILPSRDGQIELVDVEGMYSPNLRRPEVITPGSPGYAHISNINGIWEPTADRFAGAIILAEILMSASLEFGKFSFGESFFSPKEIHTDCIRFQQVKQFLDATYGGEIANLFKTAWNSSSLDNCPTFAQWLSALPKEVSALQESDRIIDDIQPIILNKKSTIKAQTLIDLAQQKELQGDLTGAENDLLQAFDLSSEANSLRNQIQVGIENIRRKKSLPPPLLPVTIDDTARLFNTGYLAYQNKDFPQANRFLQTVVLRNPRFIQNGIRADMLLAKAKIAMQSTPAKKEKPALLSAGLGLLIVIILFVILTVIPILISGSHSASAETTGENQLSTSNVISTSVISTSVISTSVISTSVISATQIPDTVTASSPILSKTLVTQTPSTIKNTMVEIPAGEFSMGANDGDPNEQPIHIVYIDAFSIDKNEVTNAMFSQFTQQSGYITNAERTGKSLVNKTEMSGADWRHPVGPASNITNKELYPVVNVSWNDALAYCQWAGKRLPTEAEWEKAARGTQDNIFPWGNLSPNGSEANINSGSTMPVGSYTTGTSPYGALDMAGNVWEWVNDWYGTDYYQISPKSNPQGASSAKNRAIRGGSFNYDVYSARSANRSGGPQDSSSNDVGFRCAK